MEVDRTHALSGALAEHRRVMYAVALGLLPTGHYPIVEEFEVRTHRSLGG